MTTVLACFSIFFLGGSTAAAHICPAYVRYMVKTGVPDTYAVLLAGQTTATLDVVLTLYAGDNSYEASIPGVTFARPEAVDPGLEQTWDAAPAYLRLPPGSATVDAVNLDVADPQTHTRTGCTSEISDMDVLQPPAAANDAFQASAKSDVAQAVATYKSDVSTAPAVLLSPGPRPNCKHRTRDAAVIVLAPASYPSSAQQLHHIGNVRVKIELDPAGKVVSTELYHSSGWPELDAAGIDAAARTTYSPEIFRCAAVASIYQFSVNFVP